MTISRFFCGKSKMPCGGSTGPLKLFAGRRWSRCGQLAACHGLRLRAEPAAWQVSARSDRSRALPRDARCGPRGATPRSQRGGNGGDHRPPPTMLRDRSFMHASFFTDPQLDQRSSQPWNAPSKTRTQSSAPGKKAFSSDRPPSRRQPTVSAPDCRAAFVEQRKLRFVSLAMRQRSTWLVRVAPRPSSPIRPKLEGRGWRPSRPLAGLARTRQGCDVGIGAPTPRPPASARGGLVVASGWKGYGSTAILQRRGCAAPTSRGWTCPLLQGRYCSPLLGKRIRYRARRSCCRRDRASAFPSKPGATITNDLQIGLAGGNDAHVVVVSRLPIRPMLEAIIGYVVVPGGKRAWRR